jgi:IS1 family transposase
LPSGVEKSGYQARTVGIVAILSGMYHLSHRAVKNVMWDLFGVEIGLGSIHRLRREASQAVSPAVGEAQNYVQAQPIVGADETGFKQGNGDAQNGKNRKAWLWVAVTPLVSFFMVLLSRSAQAAKQLLGDNFAGFLNCDRYGAYNWLPPGQKQFCWAHLKREFTKMAERSGVSQRLGQALLEQEKKLFALWYRVRDGTLDRTAFQREVGPIRAAVKDLLQQGADYQIGAKEKTPLAKTVRTCRQLLKAEPALWLFVTVEGLAPTNNAAERAIRPAVLWRRVSFGSQSQAGSVFVARMLTVVTSLRSQGRNVLEFMTAAIQAARQGTKPPSLLPWPSSATEPVTLVA